MMSGQKRRLISCSGLNPRGRATPVADFYNAPGPYIQSLIRQVVVLIQQGYGVVSLMMYRHMSVGSYTIEVVK